MAWIPRNKTTGVEYPAITDAEKAQWEADPMTKGRYTYKAAEQAPKKAQSAPKKPVGVPDPQETPNE